MVICYPVRCSRALPREGVGLEQRDRRTMALSITYTVSGESTCRSGSLGHFDTVDCACIFHDEMAIHHRHGRPFRRELLTDEHYALIAPFGAVVKTFHSAFQGLGGGVRGSPRRLVCADQQASQQECCSPGRSQDSLTSYRHRNLFTEVNLVSHTP